MGNCSIKLTHLIVQYLAPLGRSMWDVYVHRVCVLLHGA